MKSGHWHLSRTSNEKPGESNRTIGRQPLDRWICCVRFLSICTYKRISISCQTMCINLARHFSVTLYAKQTTHFGMREMEIIETRQKLGVYFFAD